MNEDKLIHEKLSVTKNYKKNQKSIKEISKKVLFRGRININKNDFIHEIDNNYIRYLVNKEIS